MKYFKTRKKKETMSVSSFIFNLETKGAKFRLRLACPLRCFILFIQSNSLASRPCRISQPVARLSI